MKNILTTLAANLLALFLSAQVGINNSNALPDNSAMLDVRSSNRGLLIPRIALTGTNDVITIPSPTLSLLIFNTATAGAGSTSVIPGYY